MKRGTPDHPKVMIFAEHIGRRRPEAIGYLELLFHFTAQYAPDGAIGKYDDKRIAAGIDWMGRPSLVIDALVAAGWLDRHPGARLVVHDWADHADRSTLARLSRMGKMPIKQNQQITGKVCTQSVPKENTRCELDVHQPEPEPEPTTLPEPEPVPHNLTMCVYTPDLSDIARRIWEQHPGHRRGSLQSAENDLASRCGSALNPLRLAESILEKHSRFVASAQWRSGKAMGLTRWLTTDGPGSCMSEPPPAEEARPQTFSDIRRQTTREKFLEGMNWEAQRG